MPEPNPDLRLEIAHVLFIDIVGSSKFLTNEQSELLRQLNQIVRSSEQVRGAEAAGKLTRLPTGDGMALAFFTTPDAPVRCALEISKALKDYPHLPLRMGIHSGPVDEVVDVNERSNVAGAGITMAQRVMDCGDAGHILLSKRIAEDLAQYSQWRPHLHDLGECDVKHAVRVGIVNLYTGDLGNPALPEKLKREREIRSQPAAAIGAGVTRRRKFMRAGVIFLGALALILGFWFLYHRAEKRSISASVVPGGAKRIAVLPFKPLVADNRDPVLELGMADSLIAKLSNSREVIVPSLNSVRKYGGLEQDSLAAGRELQVNSVLEGNVQKVGDRIRVTARLLNVTDGSSLWSDTFDEKFTDVFSVQDTISRRVADALALRLSGEEQKRLTKRYTDNVEAYQLYIAGRYHLDKVIPPEIRTAIGFFQKAIELDHNYALAYFGLAQANRSLAITSDVPSADCLPQAKAAAEKALEIDGSLAEAHASLSFIVIWFDWDWAGGKREAERALALDPNSAFAHFAHGHVLSDLGRHDEAIAEIARARELEPAFLLIRALEGMVLYHAGRDDEAIVRLQKALELDPNFWITHLTLGKVYARQRKYSDAEVEFSKARELSHGNSEAIASGGYVAALAGDTAKARAVLDELKGSERYIPPVNVALVFNGLGDQNEALSWLDKACEQRDVRLTLLKVDPRWDSFRSNPRFITILKRIGLQ
jgi:TolB-like protein/tetratricopeptide (TPR) repeat protein/class 3 adenylate cyclase